MTDELLTRAIRDPDIKVDERRLDLRLVRWGEVATRTMEGIHETFVRGAFEGTDASSVVLESQRHDGAVVGVAESIDEREDGAYATFRVARTANGDELLTLASEGVLRGASVVFHPVKHRNVKGVVERQRVELARVAVLPRGAYPSAQVLSVRSEDMEVPVTDPVVQPVDLSPTIARVDNIETAIARMEALAAVPPATDLRYRSLRDFTEAVFRREIPSPKWGVQSSDEAYEIVRTVADQLTSNNAGVNANSWITDVKRIVNLGRRAITAMGGPQPLPESGLTISYPFLSSSNTLIAAQATQKTEIQSARVDIDAGTATVATYAGGSDISRQLLDRSSPSYLEAYQRIMLAAWASVTDNAFVNALEAASGTTTQLYGNILEAGSALATSAHADDIFDTTPDHGLAVGDPVVFSTLTGGDATTAALVGRVSWVVATSLGAKTFRVALTPGGSPITWGTADISAGTVHKVGTTALKLRQSLFQASISVESATGTPASVALASTDVFTMLAGLSDVVPTYDGNPSNASGIGMASTLRLNISGLEIVHAPAVDAGKLVLTNPSAAAWLEDGPRWIRDDDVMLLGENIAVYSYAAPAVYVPAGIVEVTFV